ncbi:hypothetical protein I3760_13G175700 [Carya illinoinensis]|nr:hypothetical protein I3760_13G175700 [Carya illinoinensis]
MIPSISVYTQIITLTNLDGWVKLLPSLLLLLLCHNHLSPHNLLRTVLFVDP